MKNKYRTKVYSLLASIFLMISIDVSLILSYVDFGSISRSRISTFLIIHTLVYFLAMGIAPLLARSKPAVPVITGLLFAVDIAVLIATLAEYGSVYSLFAVLEIAFQIISLILMIVYCTLALTRSKTVCKLWFLPCAVYGASIVFGLANAFVTEASSLLIPLLSLLVAGIARATALLFIGLWLKEEVDPSRVSHDDVPAENPDIEKLKQLKALLDEGIITREEFDAKKLEILQRI